MFDTSCLPPAQFEFVVISDTHHMLDVGDRPLEFESRRRQTARIEVALKQVAALDPAFVIHLGDLSQEYPETPDFERAIAEAKAQLDRCNVRPYHVAGNHDVGDERDETMPTHPAGASSLAFYHDQFGQSWYSFDRENCHFIILNSQILNGILPETEAQWQWLESDLESHAKSRVFMFLHLPPYLWDKKEPGLGHYDNINPPDRDRLLNLVEKHAVEHLFAGHVHYAFYDRIAATRYQVLQSSSFTRPGFGHLFSSAPPPERGRDDIPKLGFYLVRVFPGRTDVHLIRTGGATELPKRTRLITGISATIPKSPLGVTLRHPVTPTGEVPLAWPSAVRQPVRNDYPFLALLELGAKTVRIPWRDLRDPYQRQRLGMLRDEGVRLTATVLEPKLPALPERMATHGDLVDTWEIQIPGNILPTSEITSALKNRPPGVSVSLCPILPNERVPGKQHLRTRVGYRIEELDALNALLKKQDITIDRALCKIPPDADPWQTIHAANAAYERISHLDFSIECTSEDDEENTARLAIALFARYQRPQSRLYADPLIDFDRTMDVTHGLLDTRCNPRLPFGVLRSLNTLLFGPMQKPISGSPSIEKTPEFDAYGYVDHTSSTWLLIPRTGSLAIHHFIPKNEGAQVYFLSTGEVETITAPSAIALVEKRPVLLRPM